ncbi:MAG: glycosyltransferase family 4 protein [Clostridium sp.]
MKIAIDARGANLYSGTGIGTYTKNLLKELVLIDDKNNYKLIWTGKKHNDLISNNFNYLLSSGRHGGFFEKYYIPEFLIKENYNLYHIPQNGLGFPFDYNLNTVVTIHDLIPYIMPETVGKGYLERFLRDMPNIISNSKGILTVSEYSKSDILRFFPNYDENKIFVTPLATNDNYTPLPKNNCREILKSKYNIQKPFILYVGGFSSRKNVMGLLDAFEMVHKNLKTPHTLLLLGSLRDEGEKIKSEVINRSLEDYVLFPGFIDDNDLPLFYNACELFVYPSMYEGFGLPPLEAMSCKTAVITSNLTSIPEVTGKDGAILINPSNTNELASKIFDVLENPLLKMSLQEEGYKRSLQFSWRQTAKNTLDAYEKIFSYL